MKKKMAGTILLFVVICYSSHSQAPTSSVQKLMDAFTKTVKDNPGDSNSADLAMKIIGNIMGGNGVSAADSAAAINSFSSATGGSGVAYQYITTFTSKQRGTQSDTSKMYFAESGDGRSEMNLPGMMGVKGANTLITLAHASQRRFSLTLNAKQKTYSLNVIDSALFNGIGTKNYQVTKIGNENVQGYNCIHARVVSVTGSGLFKTSSTMDIWTSPDVPGYSFLKTVMMQNVTPTMMQALENAGCGGFFVKMFSQGKDYSMTMALANAQQQNFPASLFQIPAGYSALKENILFQMMRPKN